MVFNTSIALGLSRLDGDAPMTLHVALIGTAMIAFAGYAQMTTLGAHTSTPTSTQRSPLLTKHRIHSHPKNDNSFLVGLLYGDSFATARGHFDEQGQLDSTRSISLGEPYASVHLVSSHSQSGLRAICLVCVERLVSATDKLFGGFTGLTLSPPPGAGN